MSKPVKISKLSAIQNDLRKLFQSGNINFLLGSGASSPAISTAGDIETEIHKLYVAGKDDEAMAKTRKFLSDLAKPNEHLRNGLQKNGKQSKDVESVLKSYQNLLENIESLLIERKTSLLPKQVSIFTTNYDVFIEKSAESFPSLILNDGFLRTPQLKGVCNFSSRNFFNSIFNNGNVYSYRVEIPSINLIKLHGSLTWKRDNDDILFQSEIVPNIAEDAKKKDVEDFIQSFCLVLPKKDKFRETIMERTYYDLLRIFANQLDKENTLLIVFGFSFVDEHIRDITIRALKNPTLKVLLWAFDTNAVGKYETFFNGYRNVEIIVADEGNLDFNVFNKTIRSILMTEGNSYESF